MIWIMVGLLLTLMVALGEAAADWAAMPWKVRLSVYSLDLLVLVWVVTREMPRM